MSRLANKRALITGGTSGIGLETAKQFLAEGAQVIVTGVTPAHIEKARIELGNDVAVLQVDAVDLAAQQELARTVQDRFGSLDIAFLNAGVSDWRPFETHDEASFDRLFTINVKSVFFLMQSLVPVLANPSSVVLNSSASAHSAAATANAYAATKGAVSALMRSWNADLLGSHGVRVNAVSPGPIATPLYDSIPAEYHQVVMDGIRADIPLGRLGEAEEIAKAVVYLASDESRFTVGADLVIDGGLTVF
ncbi:NAD(P)-dependent dehydrogenase (short-subunit alcohol dehydrogenase family) [Promicromonospora sp. AC04]|uniref:SDR family oxidoreductase n=1 Tax=Promicromonospora sp. AC04 TaxID=2135723 RepID=UPI000D335635|nr:SDR family oxidoreductase [Promicromonospora sp. AC04]PUB29847.1 NAD(P)-dependent dehydrogenase (short-subunit alcohol dehydrogenase family) [Promicromonospora sp. AC04]